MEAISLPSPPVAGLASSSLAKTAAPSRRWLSSTRSLVVPLHHPGKRRWRGARSARFPGLRPRVTGTLQQETWSNQTKAETSKQETVKQNDIAFVAGATGRVGSRTVRELLKLGFQVRAGVRNARRAEWLVQSTQNMKLDETTANTSVSQPDERLELVECNLENLGEISSAIGKASIVICCIGASEKEIFDVTGPYRIDYQATKNLIDGAVAAKVNHFILVTSLGTNKIGFPAALLNLFWGVLSWKRKAEEALIASGLPYSIVRPGGMERPTDTFKETHNLVLANEDTYFGGLVSNLQVAELIAFMAKNRSISFCKVVEAIAETTAPLTSMEELLSKIPSQRVDTSLPKEKTDIDLDTEGVPAKLVSDAVDKEPGEPLKTRPLSPYTVYDELKPPTSPTPIPSASTSSGFTRPKTVKDADQEGASEKESPNLEIKKTQPLSPYIAYEDLKPPTSPSPNAPVTSSFGSVSSQNDTPYSSSEASNTIISVPAEEKEESQHANLAKMTPLSPFTMYEDLKPPTSPSPSTPKH